VTTQRALARTLVTEYWLSSIGHLVMLVLVVALERSALPRGLLVEWPVVIVALVVARIVWSHRALTADYEPATIVRVTRVLMTALGLAWGVGTALAAQFTALAPFSIIVMALAGLLAGAINTLVGDRWAFPLYALALFGPTLVADLVLMRGGERLIEVALILLFLVFITIQHRRAHRALVQRLRIEDDLRVRERQLAAAQAIAHVGSWEWDMVSNLVTWSDELRRIYGVSPAAPAGYDEFLAVVHPEDLSRLQALIAEAIHTRQAMDYEWRAVRPDGEIRHILGRNIVITDPTGQAIRMAGTSFDITERKLAEDEVKVLQGILPICASCKRIKNDTGKWEAVESYVREHSAAEFSHGLCPDCAARDWGTTPSPHKI
jgi:PAS domain S-box-containing protein